jgi:hypothetical protein
MLNLLEASSLFERLNYVTKTIEIINEVKKQFPKQAKFNERLNQTLYELNGEKNCIIALLESTLEKKDINDVLADIYYNHTQRD